MGNSAYTFGATNGPTYARRSIADTDVTVDPTDYAINFTSISASRTVTLPTPVSTGATSSKYLPFLIKDESGSVSGGKVINVVVSGGSTIDGATSKQISNAYGSIRVYTDGVKYYSS